MAKRSKLNTLEESTILQQRKLSIPRIIFSRTMLVILLLLLNFAVMFFLVTQLLQGLPLLFGSVTVFTAVMLLVVLNGKEDPSVKLTWSILIAVLPLPGTVMYLFAKFDAGAKLSKKALAHSVETFKPWLPSCETGDPNVPELSHYLRQYGNAAVYTHSHAEYFPLGEDMFAEMLVQLEKAERYIFLEFFIVAPGYMWGKILEILHRKAKEGVEVRLMYDGTNAMANLPDDYPQQMEKLGIQCKVFSPVLPFLSTHYNNRDHRKILVIDGKVAFTGGINIQDRYINRVRVFGHWKDTGIMVQGPAAHGFTMLFLQLWNAVEKDPVLEPYMQMPAALPEEGYFIPFGDIPTDAQQIGKQVYLHILNRAQKYVYIMTPYLILDKETENALAFAAQRGVDVRLILPHIPDKRTAFALAKSHYAALKSAGVRIFEYTPGFVHAKVFLSDGVRGVVGTINLDYRSLYHHYECGVYLEKTKVLEQIASDFEDTFSKCTEVSEKEARHPSFGYRIVGKLLKVIAPLM